VQGRGATRDAPAHHCHVGTKLALQFRPRTDFAARGGGGVVGGGGWIGEAQNNSFLR
jgi:hypothetical protein